MTQHNEAAAADEARTVVYLGNRNAIVVREDGDRESYPGKRCTTIRVRHDANLLEAMQEIAAAWSHTSDDRAPAWVAAEGPLADGLLLLLAGQYPGIETRDPEPDNGQQGGDV